MITRPIAMVLAGTGVAIGMVAAYYLSKMLTSLLFATDPGDPLTFAAVAGVLMGVALVASYAPAMRATRIDPILALRAE